MCGLSLCLRSDRAVLILIEVLRYGICKTSSMTLKVTIPENLNYIGLFDDILVENTTSWHLKRVKTTNLARCLN